MQPFLIRSLLLISLTLVFQACRPQKLGDFKRTERVITSQSGLKAPFRADFKSHLYKAKLSYGKRGPFGGLIALKQLKPEVYRMVFMAKFGMTMFDFEFGENGFVVHKAFEKLNRPILLKVLENDMRLLLLSGRLAPKTTVYTNTEGQKAYRSKLENKPIWVVTDKKGRVAHIQRANEVHVDLKKYFHNRPRLITIQHKTLPLKMELKRLK